MFNAKKYQKEYREKHPEKKARILEYQHNMRRVVIGFYSNGKMMCACCGEKEIKFLSVDHLNGGGNKHRKEQKITNIYAWITRHNFPSGFQILCHNCNLAKGLYGKCPHVVL